MGTYIKGVLGGFQGTIGTVVGSTWKGIDYMKSRSRNSSKARSQKQLVQQAKFSLLINFVSTISKLLLVGFKDSAIKMTGINSAFAYNYDNAITGSYPAFSLDYSKVLVSKGQLHNAGNPVATAVGNGSVKIDWIDNSGIAMANATDKSMIVVYCRDLNQAVYTIAGADRSTATDTINAGNFTGKTVETWVAFISADEADVATSIYTGQLTVL
ncbi:MAG: DUF6266 family protein [Ferruginibacter sp.]